MTVTKYTDPTDLTGSTATAEGNPQTPTTSNLPASSGTTYTAIPGKYVVIDAPGLSGNIATMFVNISYTTSDIPAGVHEADLRVYTWNSGTGKWEALSPSGDDAANKVVWGVTTHLSIYGVIAVASSGGTSTSTSTGDPVVAAVVAAALWHLQSWRLPSSPGCLPRLRLLPR